MGDYRKPERWKDSKNKLFPHSVGFTCPPHDFDGAPTDFLKISPDTVGVHGRMLHAPIYAHELTQRVDNFHLLEEVVECMANNGADVVGQVGTNWVHAGGRTPDQIREFLDRMADTYETPLHMAGYCLVEGLRELGAEKIALNSVYYWPDWRDGITRFLKDAGFDMVWYGNFVDQGFFATQEECNDQTWIFREGMLQESMQRVADKAPDVDAYVINGMPNFRRADGLPQRPVSFMPDLENTVGKPIVSSDVALYWRIMKTLGIKPTRECGKLMQTLT